jgi:hypothetical protein
MPGMQIGVFGMIKGLCGGVSALGRSMTTDVWSLYVGRDKNGLCNGCA